MYPIIRKPVLGMQQPIVPAATEGSFVRGFVAAACVSAFQDTQPAYTPKQLKRVLRHALQGGTALAAGAHTAAAFKQGNYLNGLLSAAAGAAGVLALECMLQESSSSQNVEADNGQEA